MSFVEFVADAACKKASGGGPEGNFFLSFLFFVLGGFFLSFNFFSFLGSKLPRPCSFVFSFSFSLNSWDVGESCCSVVLKGLFIDTQSGNLVFSLSLSLYLSLSLSLST